LRLSQIAGLFYTELAFSLILCSVSVLENKQAGQAATQPAGEFRRWIDETFRFPLLDNQDATILPVRICFPEQFAAALQASVIWKDASSRALGTGVARDRVTIT